MVKFIDKVEGSSQGLGEGRVESHLMRTDICKMKRVLEIVCTTT